MLQRIGLRLQYVSDIHLEYRNKIPIIKPKTNYLALLGDIGYPNQPIYHEFLKYCSQNWDQVILLSGNHEYWAKHTNIQDNNVLVKNDYVNKNTHFENIDLMISNLVSKYDNIHFLNNASYLLDNHLILGTTLWSKNPDHPRILTEHRKSVNWLEDSIDKNSHQQIIVLTHHLPSYRLIIPKYQNHPNKHRYATNLDYLIKPPISAWLCGHSHCQFETKINNIYCGINAYNHFNE